MADTLSMGTMFDPHLVAGMFSTVKGISSVAALCPQDPISFTGNKYMVFSMDDEIQIVGENEQKTSGQITITPVTVQPIKIVWGGRVSDEFMYANDEERLGLLEQWTDGFTKKVATGLDQMVFNGINPRTQTKSSLIPKSFADITNVVTYDSSAPDDCLQEVINALGDYDCTGIAMSKDFATAMGSVKAQGIRLYPEFAFGAKATSFYGMPCSVNSTVNSYDKETQIIVGDFSAFKWGFSKEIPLTIIPYGDPDQTGVDLAAHNQVYLRAEAYVGFGILVDEAFAKIAGSVDSNSVKTTSTKKAA